MYKVCISLVLDIRMSGCTAQKSKVEYPVVKHRGEKEGQLQLRLWYPAESYTATYFDLF